MGGAERYHCKIMTDAVAMTKLSSTVQNSCTCFYPLHSCLDAYNTGMRITNCSSYLITNVAVVITDIGPRPSQPCRSSSSSSSIPWPWGSLGHHRWSCSQFLPFCLFSIALWDLANSRPVHSLMLSSHLFFCLPCLHPPFTLRCKMVLARPDEWEIWPYHCSLCLITMIRRSLCGLIVFWILAWTSSLITWSLYEMRSILR